MCQKWIIQAVRQGFMAFISKQLCLYIDYRDDSQTVGICLESPLPFLRDQQWDYINWRSAFHPGLFCQSVWRGRWASLRVTEQIKDSEAKVALFFSSQKMEYLSSGAQRGFTPLLFIFQGISWFGTENKSNSGLHSYSYFLYSSCSHIRI